MIKYIIKRLLIFIPTLIAISLLAFVISVNSPADPVEQLTRAASSDGNVDGKSSAEEKIKNEIRKKLGLDLPVFYFGITHLNMPDSIHKIPEKATRENLSALINQYGTPELVMDYHSAIESFLFKIKTLPDSIRKKDEVLQINFALLQLKEESNPNTIDLAFQNIEKQQMSLGNIYTSELNEINTLYSGITAGKSKWKNWIPKIQFNGFDNQYHLWLFGDIGMEVKRNRSGAILGDFGDSFSDNQPITDKILDKFWYSFVLVIASIFIAYIISIPLGVYSAYYKESLGDRVSTITVFMLYSLPSYFVGTLLLYWFANPDNLVWFPSGGVKNPAVFDPEWGFFKRMAHQAPYFVLPLISYSYSSFAFISRIMRVGMINELSQDYVRTARSKGLSEKKVVFKHVLRNALLPIVTMIANVFPAALGGSVILETIFSIPGLGLEIYNAVVATDIPMIVAVFSLTGLLTVIGYLVSDILYAMVDPRISYK
jgi:peptide/nickel transport system permease protein